MISSIKIQKRKIEKIHPVLASTINFSNGDIAWSNGMIPYLLVVPSNCIPIKILFEQCDFGKRIHNTWSLETDRVYDIVHIPDKPYVLFDIVVNENNLPATIQKHCFDQNESRPLTLCENVNLLFQFPELFTQAINGMQALGSRYRVGGKNYSETDHTLELEVKGNVGKRFLQLTAQQHHYHEFRTLIPHTKIT